MWILTRSTENANRERIHDGATQEADQTDSEPSGKSTATESLDTTSDLPYKYRRGGVQNDRDHGNIFLRDVAQDHVDELVDRMGDVFETESVYKVDVLEAALLGAGEPDRTVETEFRKMGYEMK
ncbi:MULTISPECIES: hypothetical protein [unclassified Haloarcula]|uniref:hypothetical protein n=1 Tax=unclassified Haloarcula TaxID=2624677 RepID=UPI00177EEAE3|nr:MULTISPECIES: hypothetical protein [unclassified Haloarcula]